MTFEEARQQYIHRYDLSPNMERLLAFERGWNAATAEAEKRAKEREAVAKLNESKWWAKEFAGCIHQAERPFPGCKACDRLSANRLAALPTSGQAEGCPAIDEFRVKAAETLRRQAEAKETVRGRWGEEAGMKRQESTVWVIEIKQRADDDRYWHFWSFHRQEYFANKSMTRYRDQFPSADFRMVAYDRRSDELWREPQPTEEKP
jgi:hypothetical protein